VKYIEARFSVPAPGTKSYRDGWERTFGRCPSCRRKNDETKPGDCRDSFHDEPRDDDARPLV